MSADPPTLTSRVNPPLTDALVEDLVRMWVDVTNDGGAVGFTPPVDDDTVATAVAGFWDRVIDGVTDLVVVDDDTGPAGFGFLTPAADEVVARHRAEVQKVMSHPDVRGAGVGTAVMDGLEARARDRGLTLVTLTVRGGTGREAFYLHRGYHLVATLPDWLLVDDRPTDSLVLARWLDGRPPPERTAEGPADGDDAVHGPPQEIMMPTPVPLPIRRLDPDLPAPRYQQPGDAGLDLHAREDRVLPPGTRCVMPTGIAVAIPNGWVGLVHPRSGLAVREGLSIINTPGTIDAGYRGELKVPLINLDPSATIRISRGDRIAQLLLQQVGRADLVEVDQLPDGVRGEGGFGSTGT